MSRKNIAKAMRSKNSVSFIIIIIIFKTIQADVVPTPPTPEVSRSDRKQKSGVAVQAKKKEGGGTSAKKRSKERQQQPSPAPPPIKKTKKTSAGEAARSTPETASVKALIRPSKLGGFEGFSTPPPSAESAPRLFDSSPAELIVEGKRQWKPSFKVQVRRDSLRKRNSYSAASIN